MTFLRDGTINKLNYVKKMVCYALIMCDLLVPAGMAGQMSFHKRILTGELGFLICGA